MRIRWPLPLAFVTAAFVHAGCATQGLVKPVAEETPAPAAETPKPAGVEATPAVPADAGTARAPETPAAPRRVKRVIKRRATVAAAPVPSATVITAGGPDSKGGRSWWWLMLLILLLVAGLVAWRSARGRGVSPSLPGGAGGRAPPRST
ncbi:MAG: hypothetical protein AAB152_18745 [Candidatus Coatesbacteria bacterium]